MTITTNMDGFFIPAMSTGLAEIEQCTAWEHDIRPVLDTFSLHFLSEILLLSFPADLSTVVGKGKKRESLP